MTRTRKIVAGVVAGLLTITVGTALALSNVSLTLGTVASYDFGSFGGSVPGTVLIQGFNLKPGETIPWHYHKGLSYVILVRGTLTETHVSDANQCGSEDVAAGSAFVEPPGLRHTVTNTGQGAALIWWATVFPSSDGIVSFSPQFQSGGIYPVDPPIC